MEKRYDVLVIGSGIAGLFYALETHRRRPDARIAIVTKKRTYDSNTNRAQGGIAAVLAGTDSFDAHIKDTLETGGGLSNPDAVERIIEAGPAVIEKLTGYGVAFTSANGSYSLGREGGHSAPRVLHAADLTGREIERAMVTACKEASDKVDIYPNHIVLDLCTFNSGGVEQCGGAFVFSEAQRTFDSFYAPVTMLASGGIGQVYYHTTNPKIATGDGIALAHRAGVSIANMEFVQFHPTTLYNPGRPPFLISEAVRGEGGRLRTLDGRFLMEDAHPLKDLAPRDVVARAIDRELKATGDEYVLLDCTDLDASFIKKRFPNIHETCMKRGFDMTERSLPVVPAAHYACGGVLSNVDGKTELAGLYVAGEVAMCGMHGANRLASNSLLEAVVMADLASKKSIEHLDAAPFPDAPAIDNAPFSSLEYPREKILIAHDRRQLGRVMSDFVGIMRGVDRLELAQEKVRTIKNAIEQYYLSTPVTYDIVELRNMATVADLIIRSALMRKESRGLHQIEEYPDTRPEFLHDTIIKGSLADDHARSRTP